MPAWSVLLAATALLAGCAGNQDDIEPDGDTETIQARTVRDTPRTQPAPQTPGETTPPDKEEDPVDWRTFFNE